MELLALVILAAGRGKRMASDLPKVTIRTVRAPLIQHVLQTASALSPARTVVVTGFKRDTVEEAIKSAPSAPSPITIAQQIEQRGTGDAVKAALPAIADFKGTILILYGDVPLIRPETLTSLLKKHTEEKATISLLSFIPPSAKSYGRIVRDPDGEVLKVVEARDCSATERALRECNSGIYAVDSAFLAPALESLTNNNAQGEYYLTDIIEKAAKEGQRIAAMIVDDYREVEGVNTLADLAQINSVLWERRREALLEQGVMLLDPSSTFIDEESSVGPGTVVGPHVQIRGRSTIGARVTIEGSAFLKAVTIGDDTTLKLGVRAEECHVGARCAIGPFAHLRPATKLADEVHIGNFVETKNASLAQGVKANHLTYLGDCSVGSKTNIGAGTITCNYDGYKKHQTTIGANVFVGSDTCLVAPVTVEDGAVIGAGSVITKNVAQDSLAFTRPPQLEKSGWAAARREKMKK